MEAIKDFLQSPVQSYLNLLKPSPFTGGHLYTIASVVGMAAAITAIATYALFLLGPTFILLPTALLIKKICIIAGLASALGFLVGFCADKANEGDRLWAAVYAGAIVAATIVPAILLVLNGMSMINHR